MLKIIVSQWEKNKDELRSVLSKIDLNDIGWADLVRLTFEIIYNNDLAEIECDMLDLEAIHEIDDGNYQGTLLFLIPFKSYQPREYEYLMTYVGYGSCSGCDALLSIRSGETCEAKVNEFMGLCKDILTNTIKPYNDGWRENDFFNHIEEE